jgi:hypothetical protein
MARAAVLLAVALLFAQSPVGRPGGTIAGVAVDVDGGALPGTTITVNAGSIVRTAVTDPFGRFFITGLPDGRYTAAARLVGFEGASHEDIDVTRGRSTHVKFVLRIACLGHVDYIDNGLPWVINQSDVIAHIRIPALDTPAACPATPSVNHCACTLHQPAVLQLLKGHLGESRQLRLIQNRANIRGEEPPYVPGDEFIAFLKLDVSARAFDRVSGPLYMFRIRNGRIDLGGRTLTSFTDGMTVAEFRDAIQALTQAAGEKAGRVTGVATDMTGAAIPGATITLRWAESERTVFTDGRGAFSFYDVPPGRYAVIASLQGFYSLPHRGVVVSPGASATLMFELETDCMRPGEDAVDLGLAGMRNEAELIAHIRITALVPPAACAMRSHCACTLHHATVLRAIKGQPLRELRLLQEGAGYASVERPYAAGDEFIALLKRDDESHAFVRMTGPRYMFRVRNDRVDLEGRALPGFRNGMTVAEFEKALAAMTR